MPAPPDAVQSIRARLAIASGTVSHAGIAAARPVDFTPTVMRAKTPFRFVGGKRDRGKQGFLKMLQYDAVIHVNLLVNGMVKLSHDLQMSYQY